MTLAISISPDAERRLASRANVEGVDVSTLATRLLESAVQDLDVPETHEAPPHKATLKLLKKWAEESKTLSEADMEQGEREFRELMEGMNAARIESDGPDARKPFP